MGEILSRRLKQAKFESSEDEALLNLLVAANHIRRQVEAVCADFGITHGQYNVLRILKGVYPGGHPRNEIIARMIEWAPDVTRVIDRLEAQGLAERTRSDDDRRLSMTRITEKGITLINTMAPRITVSRSLISSVLSREECQELSRLCEKIYGQEI